MTKADAAFCAPTESTDTVFTPLIERCRSTTEVLNGTRTGLEGKRAPSSGSRNSSSSFASGGVTGRKWGRLSRTQDSSLLIKSFEANRSKTIRPPRPTRRRTRPKNLDLGVDKDA